METSFGEFVKARRLELRLTQREVALAIKLKSIAFLSEVESDHRPLGKEYWSDLADILQTTYKEIASRDVKVPLQKARELLTRNPDFAVAFRRVVELTKELGPDETLRRLNTPPT